MLPMRFFRRRAFAAANVMALLMYAALFGALFLLTQLLQTGLGATPWEAGLRMLPDGGDADAARTGRRRPGRPAGVPAR